MITPASICAALDGDIKNFLAASTPGGIELQEKEGQQDLVRSSKLPKEITNFSLNKKSSKEIYGMAGIQVLSDCDDIFFNVKIPKGWKIVETDHSMWSKLMDDKDRKRASIFYKASFYDVRSHLNFDCRFNIMIEHEDAYKSVVTYLERKKMKVFGRVYDLDNVVFQTSEGYVFDDDNWDHKHIKEEGMKCFCKKWLEDNKYPEYDDPFKYWD